MLPVYGGQGMISQLRHLKRGVHAIVGTPGRVLDHLRRGTMPLGGLSSVVLDEADEMLKMGFIDDVKEILEHTPEKKQVALFSATMPRAIREVADQYLNEPAEIRIRTKTATVATVTQRYWRVRGMDKLDALTRILEVEDFDAMLVFVRTRTATTELAERLEARGHSAAPLSGEMIQPLRESVLRRLRSGDLDIVVATDVAARGLDVDRISHVVNYDIPNDAEAYVHRIGRTSRAGRSGHAILFVTPRERRMLAIIERATRQPIEAMRLPSRQDVVDRRIAQFKQTIEDTIENQSLEFYEGLIGTFQEESKFPRIRIAAALAFLAQRERPLLPLPAERPDPVPVEKPRERKPRREPRPEPGSEPRSRKKGSAKSAPARAGKGGAHEDWRSYRVEVGRRHGVEPGNIVGAIANEAGLESVHIGRVRIFDEFSLVQLPPGMPTAVFKHLKSVWVCGQKLKISLDKSAGETPAGDPPPGRKDKGPRDKGPRGRASRPKR